MAVSRPNFVELCLRLTAEDERAFEELWRTLGLSVDWELTYATIGERVPAGLPAGLPAPAGRGPRLPARGAHPVGRRLPHGGLPGRARRPRAPRRLPPARASPGPTATAAGRDRDHPARAAGGLRGPGGPPRRRPLPPALRHRGASPRCSGCGSRWWPTRWPTPRRARASPWSAPSATPPTWCGGASSACPPGPCVGPRRPARPGRPGASRGWESDDPPAAAGRLRRAGRPDGQAGPGPASSSCWPPPGTLVGEPRPITHPVKFYEQGERPLEIVSSRQWFVRTLDLRDRLLARGEELPLAPALHGPPLPGLGRGAQQRLEHQPPAVLRGALPGVVPGRRRRGRSTTTARWCPPRTGCRSTRRPTCPTGYAEDQRGRPGGFVGDPDVMDTWATSSLTPQIAGRWEDDPDLFARVFPMDLRPQAHDIIRTWLFSTVVRAELEFGSLPWTDAAISGWVLDPDRKKMSKSKGNVVTPLPLLVEHGADAVRYWAASGRPGTDTAVDEGQMKVGRRLAIKVLNASQVRPRPAGRPRASPGPSAVTAPLDRDLLAPAGRGGRGGHGGLRGLRLHPGPRGRRGLLLVVLRRLPGAGQVPRLRRPGRARHRLGPGRPGAGPVGPAPAVRPVPALRHRGGLELVAGGLGPPGAVAVAPTSWRPALGPDGARRRLSGARRGGRGPRRRPAAEDHREALDAGPGRLVHRGRPGRAAGRPAPGRGRPGRGRGLDELVLVEGDDPSISVVLAPEEA